MKRLQTKYRGHRSGFTVVELVMGLLVMSIIFAAIAGLAVAMGDGWQATSAVDSLQVARRQTSTQLYHNLRSAKFIGLATPDNSGSGAGGALVIFWKGDQDPGEIMYAYQVAVIEHDLATATLRLHQLPKTAGGAMTEFKSCCIDEAKDVDDFKKLPGITSQVIGRNVTGVSFKVLPVSSTRQTQALEFQIRYKSGEQEQLEYGTATVRVPQVPPS